MSTARERANALAMWSNEKPTVSGYWWLQDGTAKVVVYVDIGTCDSFYYARVEFCGGDQPINLCDVNGLWAGPLEPPQEGGAHE